MASLGAFLRGLFACGGVTASATGSAGAAAAPEMAITRPGLFDATPDVSLAVLVPGPQVTAALTGPDSGAASLEQQLAFGVDIPWQLPQDGTQETGLPQQQQQQQQHSQHQHSQQQQQPYAHVQQHAWGHATSLYDRDPATGQRNGDPVADCYGIITYQRGAVMALADGVNWGQRSQQAARAAVLGFCSHLHSELALQQGGRGASSTALFASIRGAVMAAHKAVLAAEGTMTTLVGALVCAKRWGGGAALLAVAVGDSPCYVWRAASGCVEEVTYLPPLHGFHRDPRVCPGCLGYAVGHQPDLTNITYSLTQLQPGDLVLLASDGISDNFDPIMRKKAAPISAGLFSKSPRASAAAQAAAQAALAAAAACETEEQQQQEVPVELTPLSPASCHVRALDDMARVLRAACGSDGHQPQQPGSGNSNGHLGSPSVSGGAPLPPCSVKGGGGGGGGAPLSAAAAVSALVGFASAATAAQRQALEDPSSGTSRDGPHGGAALVELLAALPGKLDHASVAAYRVGG